MMKKTVIKLLLSKWGLLSLQMQKAIEYDQAVVKDDLSIDYEDNKNEPVKPTSKLDNVEEAEVVENEAN